VDHERIAIDLVLTMYQASYKTPDKPQPIITVQNGPIGRSAKPQKPRDVGSKSSIESPKPTIVAPPKGSLTPEGFLLALRNAGMRKNNHGVLIRHPLWIHSDEQIAIAAYLGYEWGEPHGIQLEGARRKATFDVSQYKGRIYSRCTPSIDGFIAGMPDLVNKHEEDLMAREREVANAMIAYEKEYATSKDGEQRRILQGKALIERERLRVIKEDLVVIALARCNGEKPPTPQRNDPPL